MNVFRCSQMSRQQQITASHPKSYNKLLLTVSWVQSLTRVESESYSMLPKCILWLLSTYSNLFGNEKMRKMEKPVTAATVTSLHYREATLLAAVCCPYSLSLELSVSQPSCLSVAFRCFASEDWSGQKPCQLWPTFSLWMTVLTSLIKKYLF